MKKGALRPIPIDPKDKHFRFQRLFGSISSFPDFYQVNSGFLPDQNLDNRPSECTGYTIVDIGATEDGVAYSPDYNYMKTLEVMNLPPTTEGADARTAFKVACTFGLLPKSFQGNFSNQSQAANPSSWSLDLDTEAKKNVKSAYLPIAPVPDFFDGVRSAIFLGENEKRAVGIATQWSPTFEQVGKDGILNENPQGLYWGHMYEACGWKTIGGQPYLILKTWQGSGYGDHGYCYMSRALCNKLMSAWGAYAASIEKLSPGKIDNLKAQQATYIEVAIALIQNLLMKLGYQFGLL